MRPLALALAAVLACLPLAARAEGGTIFVTGYVEVGTTADGTPTGPGVAACPPGWMGRTLAIEGVGTVVCHDAYASWLSPRVDVWLPTVEACYAVTGYHTYEVVG